jgi:HPt (histidine-containing phosphotransfer) domain-containing protein
VIEKVWAQRRLAVLDQIDVIDQAAEDLLQGRVSDALREPAQREAHKLIGSLGTFGFSRGSSIAREMEAILERGPAIRPIDAVRLSELLVELREELSRPPGAPGR